MKPAPPPRMVPMEHSLRRKVGIDVDEGVVDDGELRQFIASQLSSHASHVQSLLDGLEQRIVATVNESSVGNGNAQKSALRQTSKVANGESVHKVPGMVRVSDTDATQEEDDYGSPRSGTPRSGNGLPKVLTTNGQPTGWFAKESKARRSRKTGAEDSSDSEDSDDSRVKRPVVEAKRSNKARLSSLVEEGLKQEIEFGKDFTQTDSINPRLIAQKSYRGQLSDIIFSRPSELTICFLIISNSIFIGAQVDFQMSNAGKPPGDAFRVFDIMFTVIFTLELALRWMAEGLPMFFLPRSPNFQWNWFDFCLVMSSLFEEMLKLILETTPDVSMLRLFRIVRLVRLFRILRVVRFFKDLRIMISGIANSMQSLVWALLLMFCVMYLVAVFVLQYAADEGEQRAKEGGIANLSDEEYKVLLLHFGGMTRTMYTLYMSITGGLDWGEASDPLFSVGWILGCFYICYIAFSVLCVMNIVTGVFVENCNQMTAQDEDLVYMEQLEQRKQWYAEVKDIFEAADEKKTGYLSLKDFSSKVKGDARLRAWMRKIGVQVETYTARGLFQLLDLDGDGLLDFDEFFIALQQVHGQARSIDVAKVLHDTKLLRRMIVQISETLGGQGPRASDTCYAEKSWNKHLWQSENTEASVNSELL